MKKKLRLLLFEECNRACPGCCNKDWDLDGLPVCDDYTPYDLIMLTGGEPMLHPEIIWEAVENIRSQTSAPVYLYTAMTDGLDALLPCLDGLTLTLHAPEDVEPFRQFDQNANNLQRLADKGTLRLNVFAEAGPYSCSARWSTKANMHWIPDCPLLDGEVLMRYSRSCTGTENRLS